jgi:cold shock CspA family protein/ribosome-associated translation inhibitor RaiA
MRLPVQITFRHMDPSPALEARIRALAARLDHFASDIMGCHVTVEAPHQHHRQGQLYEISIDITVPQGELIANRVHRENFTHEDAYVALRDAFRAVRRQLEDYERRRRLDVKHHEPPLRGRIAELYPAEDFGRIESRDGRSIYFHRHSVLGADFKQLTTGTEVTFVEEPGDRGPQASTVHVEQRAAPRL